MKEETLEQLQELLEYQFTDKSLLIEAMTHSSYADHRLQSNERLEFLGDSVLALTICRRLFDQFPDYLEGDLTKIKSMLVSRKTCSKVAGKLQLQDFTLVGKGMDKTRAMSGSIAGGTLEAVIAAIYLDGGFDSAADFIMRTFGAMIEKSNAQQHQENFKSMLQQHSQQTTNQTPIYELLDEKGPDHDKCFEIGVVIGRQRFAGAWGITKKDAEQKAAKSALIQIGLLDEDES